MITTVADLIEVLKTMPPGLPLYIANGDLPDATISSVTVVDFGQEVLISR